MSALEIVLSIALAIAIAAIIYGVRIITTYRATVKLDKLLLQSKDVEIEYLQGAGKEMIRNYLETQDRLGKILSNSH